MKLEDAIGIGILLAIIVVPLLVSDALKVRKIPKAERAEAKRKMRKETRRSLVSIKMGLGVAALAAGGIVPIILFQNLASLFVPVLLLVFIGTYFYRKFKYRDTIYAVTLANTGDSEGAVLEIRRAIEAKPDSADLWNTLAVADYVAATDALRRAAELGLDESLVRTNGAWLLWKQSLLDEALALNSIECRTNPRNFNAAVNQCHILADSGRWDDAAEQLQAIEKRRKSEFIFPASERKRRRDLIAELNEKLRRHPDKMR